MEYTKEELEEGLKLAMKKLDESDTAYKTERYGESVAYYRKKLGMEIFG